MISDQNKSRDSLTAPKKTDEVFDINWDDSERSTVEEGSLRISLIIELVSRGTEATRAGGQGGASERERLGALILLAHGIELAAIARTLANPRGR